MKIFKTLSTYIILLSVMTFAFGCGDKRNPPAPAEATDENSYTFESDDFSFASVENDDKQAADGVLSIVEIQGNRMLKFTDSGNSFEDKKIQKIRINAAELIGRENLGNVRKIEFDFYADAVDNLLVTENGRNVKAAGWIGGGGGMVDQNQEWYDFADFNSGEYEFDFSEACHVTFDFLLAESGKKWSPDMERADFFIMRWGLQNNSNIYIDNITFYDYNGNSIKLL